MKPDRTASDILCGRDLMLIINPISGTGTKQNVPQTVESMLLGRGCRLDVRFTSGRGDATSLAAEAATNGYAAVMVCGGDGTINETAKALCNTQVPLGLIPAGSGNGLARHLGVPVDVEEAVKIVLEGNVVPSDYGSVNGLPFFCTCGTGFDAAVSHRFARQSRRGLLSYIKSTLTEYLQFQPDTYTISANGKLLTEKAFLVAVCNASQWGNNAYIAPEASITDGLLDITVVHSGTPLDTAVMGMDIFSGMINKNTMVRCFRAPAAVIYRSQGGEAHIDGEPVMLDDILDVRCHRRGLHLFTPNSQGRFRPLVTPIRDILRDARLSIHHIFQSGGYNKKV